MPILVGQSLRHEVVVTLLVPLVEAISLISLLFKIAEYMSQHLGAETCNTSISPYIQGVSETS
jgi:hypothetical protein